MSFQSTLVRETRPLSTQGPITGQQTRQRRAPDDSPFQKQSHSVNKALQASRGEKTSENSHLAKERKREGAEGKEWKNVFMRDRERVTGGEREKERRRERALQ